MIRAIEVGLSIETRSERLVRTTMCKKRTGRCRVAFRKTVLCHSLGLLPAIHRDLCVPIDLVMSGDCMGFVIIGDHASRVT